MVKIHHSCTNSALFKGAAKLHPSSELSSLCLYVPFGTALTEQMSSPLLTAVFAVVSSGWAGMPHLVASGQEKGQGEEAPDASDQSHWPCQLVPVE